MDSAVVLHMRVADIRVGDRRRKDYGDIDGLAANIEKRGLLHPIVIDDDDHKHLVAGGRRLDAVKRLGWDKVPVRLLGTLTESERREIELEENIHRKNLTRDERLHVFEQAKQVLRDRSEAAAIPPASLREESEDESPADLSDKNIGKIGRGRPEKPDSDEKAAALSGFPLPTIRLDRQHAAAEARYPVLKTVPTQQDALKIAAKLDAMPEPVRAEMIEKLERRDPDTQTTLTGRPPVSKGTTPHEMADRDPERRWARIIHEVTKFISSTRNQGGIGALTRKWSDSGKRAYLAQIREWRAELGAWEEYLAGEVEHDEHVA